MEGYLISVMPSTRYVVFSAQDRHVAMELYARTNVYVKSDGNVTWYTSALVMSICPHDAALYPFDIQVCNADNYFGYQEIL